MPPFSVRYNAPSLVPGATDALLKAITLRRRLDAEAQQGDLQDLQIEEIRRRAAEEQSLPQDIGVLSGLNRPAAPSLVPSMAAPSLAPMAPGADMSDPMGEGMLPTPGLSPAAPPSLAASMPGGMPTAPAPAGSRGFTFAQVPPDVAARLVKTERGRFALQQAGLMTQKEYDLEQAHREASPIIKDQMQKSWQALKAGNPIEAIDHEAAAYQFVIDSKAGPPAKDAARQRLTELRKERTTLQDKKDQREKEKLEGPEYAAAVERYTKDFPTDRLGAHERFVAKMSSFTTDAYRLAGRQKIFDIAKSLEDDLKRKLITARQAAPYQAWSVAMAEQRAAGQPMDEAAAWLTASTTMPVDVRNEFIVEVVMKGEGVKEGIARAFTGEAKIPAALTEAVGRLRDSVNPQTGQKWRANDPGFFTAASQMRTTIETERAKGKRVDDQTRVVSQDLATLEANATRYRLELNSLEGNRRRLKDAGASITELGDQDALITAKKTQLDQADRDIHEAQNERRSLRGKEPRPAPAEPGKPRTSEMRQQRIQELERSEIKIPEKLRNIKREQWPAADRAEHERKINARLRQEGYAVDGGVAATAQKPPATLTKDNTRAEFQRLLDAGLTKEQVKQAMRAAGWQ